MAEPIPPRWQPISAHERRVLGVMAEKAKTTPDAYPMTLNAICVGCNQKSNRYPLMTLEPDDVEAALDRLRGRGAAAEIIGGGRTAKYRHYFYEWLGVDKAESAVMIELLLRGAQTEGELRGRAARMEPIADLNALRPILESLKAKGLLISLSSAGRGHVVTHALYEPREMEKLRAEFGAGNVATSLGDDDEDDAAVSSVRTPVAHAPGSPQSAAPTPRVSADELASLRNEVAQLRSELEELASRFNAHHDDLENLKSQLGV